MPQRKHLKEHKIEAVKAYRILERIQREIAKKLHRSQSVISNMLCRR